MSNLVVHSLPSLSTTFVTVIQKYRVDYTIPVMAVGATASTTCPAVGLTTNSVIVFTPRQQNNSSVVGVLLEARCSTADELELQIVNASGSTISGSTQSAYILQFGF